jgi:alkylation response protein AidB-like acyl-CoA dehydrogenase
MTVANHAHRGASWLLEETDAATIFTPERVSDEHRLIAQTVAEFIEAEVMPQIEQLETKDWALARRLVRRAGELGLLGLAAPEQCGGSTSTTRRRWSCQASRSPASFAAAYGTQVISASNRSSSLERRPRSSGTAGTGVRRTSALCVERVSRDPTRWPPHACHEAAGRKLAARRRKMWITNGGFADVFIVFNRPGGDQFTAFIERAFGVVSGHEEHKMGLHGSSTTPITGCACGRQCARRGGPGLGGAEHLNFGRFKLGAMCSGGCREAIAEAVGYARQRRQFGHAIADSARSTKLGEMTARPMRSKA